MQYCKTHAVTILATSAVGAHRFISYVGKHASTAATGAATDAQGVTEYAMGAGAVVSAITSYSALVEAAESIALGQYVKPAADGTGRAVVGDADERCGRALTSAAAGQLAEVQVFSGY